MADYVTFVASEPTIQVLGQDIVRDAQRYTFQTKLHGVVFSLVRPIPDQFTVAEVIKLADSLGGIFVALAELPGVVGVQTTQEIDALNQLHDHYLVGVTSTSGLSSTILHWDALSFNFADDEAKIAAARADLDALEAAAS